MTEQGYQWIKETADKSFLSNPFKNRDAVFWIEKFCEELERRAETIPLTGGAQKLFAAYREMREELLP